MILNSNLTPSDSWSDEARIPLLSVEEMSEKQRRLHERVISGPRGQMIGPLRAAIHSPELAELWSDLGEFLRFRTCLPVRLTELAILVTGRRWTSQIEWWVHARVGAEAGLAQSIIDAIAALKPPTFSEQAEVEVYEFARALQHDGRISPELHHAIQDRWGTRGVVELTAVIGYYTMVAMTLNAHQIPVPGEAPPLSPSATLVTLPSASLRGGA